jgi:hypothetical protein
VFRDGNFVVKLWWNVWLTRLVEGRFSRTKIAPGFRGNCSKNDVVLQTASLGINREVPVENEIGISKLSIALQLR